MDRQAEREKKGRERYPEKVKMRDLQYLFISELEVNANEILQRYILWENLSKMLSQNTQICEFNQIFIFLYILTATGPISSIYVLQRNFLLQYCSYNCRRVVRISLRGMGGKSFRYNIYIYDDFPSP